MQSYLSQLLYAAIIFVFSVFVVQRFFFSLIVLFADFLLALDKTYSN